MEIFEEKEVLQHGKILFKKVYTVKLTFQISL